MWKRGSLVSMVYRNWQTNRASVVMSKIWGRKKEEKKEIYLYREDGGIWGLILFWVWAGETPIRAICPCESNPKSQIVSASWKKEKKKRKRRDVTGELVGEREGGRTGRYCVSSFPFYSFTLVPFWPHGEIVTEEGVRNVLLLECCHLWTEESFVCCAL